MFNAEELLYFQPHSEQDEPGDSPRVDESVVKQ